MGAGARFYRYNGPQQFAGIPWTLAHSSGLAANRPAANPQNAGFLWVSTDVNGGTLYRSNGSAWVQIAAGVSAGGGAVSSVSGAGGNLSVSPTTGAVVVTGSEMPAVSNQPDANQTIASGTKCTGMVIGDLTLSGADVTLPSGSGLLLIPMSSLTATPLPRGTKDGFVLENNVTQSIGIQAGACRDSTNAVDIVTTRVFWKSLAGTWVAGSGSAASPVNGLDTGTVAASTWYHVHSITTGDYGTVDYVFSLSATAPTLPSGYSYFRRVGSIKTDGSKDVIAFHQEPGGLFLWDSPVVDVNTTLGLTATLYTLSLPTGVKVTAYLTAWISNASAGVAYCLFCPDTPTPSVSGATSTITVPVASSSNSLGGIQIATNTSGQIKAVANNAAASIQIGTFGWIDSFGRDDTAND